MELHHGDYVRIAGMDTTTLSDLIRAFEQHGFPMDWDSKGPLVTGEQDPEGDPPNFLVVQETPFPQLHAYLHYNDGELPHELYQGDIIASAKLDKHYTIEWRNQDLDVTIVQADSPENAIKAGYLRLAEDLLDENSQEMSLALNEVMEQNEVKALYEGVVRPVLSPSQAAKVEMRAQEALNAEMGKPEYDGATLLEDVANAPNGGLPDNSESGRREPGR